jgi:hypothetical protein
MYNPYIGWSQGFNSTDKKKQGALVYRDAIDGDVIYSDDDSTVSNPISG